MIRRLAPSRYNTTLLVLFLAFSGQAESLAAERPLNQPAEARIARRQAEQSQAEVIPLEQDTTVERDITEGEEQAYGIVLRARQYARITIERRGADIEATVIGPGGQPLARMPLLNQRSMTISIVVEAAGTYRLKLRMLEKRADAGRYKITLDDVREAADSDSQRLLAEGKFAAGEDACAKWKVESFRQAIESFEAARLAWSGLNDKASEARALRKIGDVYFTISEYKKALDYYTRALEMSRAALDRTGEIEALNAVGYVDIYLGESKRALDFCNQGLELSRAGGDRRGEAQALNNLGEAYYMLGELPKARDLFFSEALKLWSALGEQRGQALALINLGYVYYDLGDILAARDAFEKSLFLWRATNERRGQAQALSQIGGTRSILGEKQAALEFFNEALEIFRDGGDRDGEAATLNGIGHIYLTLGEQQKALDAYTGATELFHAAGNRDYEGVSYGLVASVYQELGEEQKALEYYQRALSVVREVSDRWNEAFMLQRLGDVYRSLGNETMSLESYNLALSLARKVENRRLEAYILNGIGNIKDSAGKKDEALEFYRQALALNRSVKDSGGEISTVYNIARIERDLGHIDKALTDIEASIKEIESLRAKITVDDLRASYFASVHQQYELYIDLLMLMEKQARSGSFAASALQVSESAHARSLLELLNEAQADLSAGADPELLNRERSRQHLLNLQAERQIRLLSGKHTEAEAEAVAKNLRELTTELAEVKAKIKTRNPHYAALTQPQPLALREIQQQVLEDDTLLLEYALGEKRSYLWAVTPTALHSYELPPREEIERLAHRMYSLLSSRQRLPTESIKQYQMRLIAADKEYEEGAQKLSEMLLGPVAAQLPGARHLLIVADGALQYLPFSALVVPATPARGDPLPAMAASHSAGLVPLMVEHEIISLPSVSALAVIRKETGSRPVPARAVAVLADPVFEANDPRLKPQPKGRTDATIKQRGTASLNRSLSDVGVFRDGLSLSRLPGSRQEAELIMQLAPGEAGMLAVDFEANRATATSAELSKYRIVHFATHGILNDIHPELSGIVLSLFDKDGRPQDGFLRLHDIYNLKLPADLIVLSACNTGLGKDIKGEGLVGLTRGFMYAGAKRVVASLWKVDDEATAELMKLFYQHMLKEKMTASSALRTAQGEIRQARVQWRAPYYWAGFVLQGDWK
jgi:CHAT domain-containing protein/predicted negative regulator of RcsB-dependent stress response